MSNEPAVVILMVVVALIMTAMGLGLAPADFRRVASDRRAVAVGLAGQLLLLPALGFVLAAVFGLTPPLAVGLVLIAACPGGAHSNLFASLARADTALSVSLTAVSGVVTVVTIPLVIRFATVLFEGRAEVVTLPILPTIAQLFVVMVLPVGLGMWVRDRRPGLATRLERGLKAVALFLLVLIVLGSISQRSTEVRAAAVAVGLPVLCLNVGAMILAWLIGRVARLGTPQSLTVVLEVGIQNGTIAFSIAAGLMGSVVVATPSMIYSLLVYLTGAVVVVVGRRLARAVPGPGALHPGSEPS